MTWRDRLLRRVRRALADRYVVERELGRGGMARVYLAEERHPRRPVAIKVLEPSVATSVGRQRFTREVRYASQLAHPHIVPILEAGEADDLLYYTMPYLPRRSLREHLRENDALDLAEALRIAGEIGDAIAYAHAQGVIHRDIKPENILLSNGHAIVADFGIAKALSTGDRLTVAGRAIGTPGYMSPEQRLGRPVDAQTDLYSLAVVTYEMLTGRPPSRSLTQDAAVAATREGGPPMLGDAGWSLPPRVVGALQRALHADPDRRFASVRDFCTALGDSQPPEADTPAAPPPPTARRPSLAVLPFTVLGDDADGGFFAEGLIDDLVSRLGQAPEWAVTSRTSTKRYGQSPPPLSEIRQDLDVTHVVIGSVRRIGTRVRIVAQLIESEDERLLWADSFDRDLDDPLRLQGELARAITAGISQGYRGRPVRRSSASDRLARAVA